MDERLLREAAKNARMCWAMLHLRDEFRFRLPSLLIINEFMKLISFLEPVHRFV